MDTEKRAGGKAGRNGRSPDAAATFLAGYLRSRTEAVSYLHDPAWIGAMDAGAGRVPWIRADGPLDFAAWKEENLGRLARAIDGIGYTGLDGSIVPDFEKSAYLREKYGDAEEAEFERASPGSGIPSSLRSMPLLRQKADGWIETVVRMKGRAMDEARGLGTGMLESLAGGGHRRYGGGRAADAADRLYQLLGTTAGAAVAARTGPLGKKYARMVESAAAGAAREHDIRVSVSPRLYRGSSYAELDTMMRSGKLYAEGPFVTLTPNPFAALATCNCTNQFTPQILLSFDRAAIGGTAAAPRYSVLEAGNPTAISDPEPVENLQNVQSRARNGSIRAGSAGMHVYAMWKQAGMGDPAANFEERYGEAFRITQFIPAR